MRDIIQETFNEHSNIEANCTGICNKPRIKEKRTELIHSTHSKYIIVILSRGQITTDGYQFVRNKVTMTDDVDIR